MHQNAALHWRREMRNCTRDLGMYKKCVLLHQTSKIDTSMNTRNTNKKLLESSIQNLRNSMGSISMDQFVLQTIESLMNIERNEFLDSCSGDKGNGSQTRAFQSLSKNGLVIKVPRTRSRGMSPQARIWNPVWHAEAIPHLLLVMKTNCANAASIVNTQENSWSIFFSGLTGCAPHVMRRWTVHR